MHFVDTSVWVDFPRGRAAHPTPSLLCLRSAAGWTPTRKPTTFLVLGRAWSQELGATVAPGIARRTAMKPRTLLAINNRFRTTAC